MILHTVFDYCLSFKKAYILISDFVDQPHIVHPPLLTYALAHFSPKTLWEEIYWINLNKNMIHHWGPLQG